MSGKKNSDGRQHYGRVSSSRSSSFFPPRGPPSVSRHLISVFPIFLFRSVSPRFPPRSPSLPRLPHPSPPFLFVFRGDRGPETDVRAVKNGRRCASGTGTFFPLPPLVPRPFRKPPFPLPPFPFPSVLNPATDALVPGPRRRNGVLSNRPSSRFIPFCSLPPVPSDFGHRPRVRTVCPFDARRALHVSLTFRKPSVLSWFRMLSRYYSNCLLSTLSRAICGRPPRNALETASHPLRTQLQRTPGIKDSL